MTIVGKVAENGLDYKPEETLKPVFFWKLHPLTFKFEFYRVWRKETGLTTSSPTTMTTGLLWDANQFWQNNNNKMAG